MAGRPSTNSEASTAKAKKLLDQLITALGGPTYLDIRDSHCEGRLARFGHNGEMSGYTPFKDYWLYPDTNRTDYSKKGVIINLFNGDKRRWSLRLTAVNITNNYALYNFLSTFSGTHYVTPRAMTAEVGFHF